MCEFSNERLIVQFLLESVSRHDIRLNIDLRLQQKDCWWNSETFLVIIAVSDCSFGVRILVAYRCVLDDSKSKSIHCVVMLPVRASFKLEKDLMWWLNSWLVTANDESELE